MGSDHNFATEFPITATANKIQRKAAAQPRDSIAEVTKDALDRAYKSLGSVAPITQMAVKNTAQVRFLLLSATDLFTITYNEAMRIPEIEFNRLKREEQEARDLKRFLDERDESIKQLAQPGTSPSV
tara:strand:+ start:65 stop:445 length:381 start_codon:yes stop_codon:yes gene_type:complete